MPTVLAALLLGVAAAEDPDVVRGVYQYRESDYVDAIATLTAALKRDLPMSERQRALAYRLATRYELGDLTRAREDALELLRLDPAYQLDTIEFTPKLIDYFEQARQSMPPPPPQTPGPPPPEPEPEEPPLAPPPQSPGASVAPPPEPPASPKPPAPPWGWITAGLAGLLGAGAAVTGVISQADYTEYLRLQQIEGTVDEPRRQRAEALGTTSIGLVAAAALAGGAAIAFFMMPGGGGR